MDEENYLRIRGEKQIYLRTNIIEKGYDPNSFSEFLQSLKGNSAKKIDKRMEII